MEKSLRLAFFPDTYDEIDGVANTSRQLEAFAKRRGLPLLIICGGARDQRQTDGLVTRIMFRRGPISFALDKKHDYDLLFWRYYQDVEAAVREFAPDFVHITGPSDVGQLGALIAHRLDVPLAASWHTNVHEYAEQRAEALIRFLPKSLSAQVSAWIRESSLSVIVRFYKIPQMLFAPNPSLIDLLLKRTAKSVFPMNRGVEAQLFRPERRDRTDDQFVIGYVGRLTVEKNIRVLPEIERALLEAGLSNFRFSIVGQGAEEPWLRANLRNADFAGVLHGEALARAYANMDAFLFPSHTDTYGNVVLEALASGVPALVTDRGGPQFIVRHGQTGFIARDIPEFARHIFHFVENPAKLQVMRQAARSDACRASWDAVFEQVYAAYQHRQRGDSMVPQGIRLRPRRSVITPQAS